MREREWTLMFYFASDNPLAASIVSQLKSIKQAGFHPDANVIAQFDPQIEGTATHIFDVNLVDKLKARGRGSEYKIGFASKIPILVTDRLWGEQESRNGGLVKDQIKESLGPLGNQYRPPAPPLTKSVTDAESGEPSPRKSLEAFLRFCAENYPARHYVLFILGHGLIVGNDIFLFDEHAAGEHSLSLHNLGKVLRGFKKQLGNRKQLELVSFHSCSMSALEVAYELQGTANYMLASQGPAFVGSWPYRQILMRVFGDLLVQKKNVKETLKAIVGDCIENSYDFQLAGYSFDLCLCDLNKVTESRAPLRQLSKALRNALSDSLARQLILLAHWDAQSYWQESYVDLYDFCLRLSTRSEQSGQTKNAALRDVNDACRKMIGVLSQGDDNIVIRSRFAGPAYQYSHGLSVFFPWSRPLDDKFWPAEYDGYRFKNTSWKEFLVEYFSETMRRPRGSEVEQQNAAPPTLEENLLEEITSPGLTGPGQLDDDPTPGGGSKTGPTDPTGGSGGPAIKNYPPYTREPVRSVRNGKKAVKSSTTRAGRKRG
jgi:hypothetical protein